MTSMEPLIMTPKIDWEDDGDWETSVDVSLIREQLGVPSEGIYIAEGNVLWDELTAHDLNVTDTPVVIICGLKFECFQSQLMIKPFFSWSTSPRHTYERWIALHSSSRYVIQAHELFQGFHFCFLAESLGMFYKMRNGKHPDFKVN